MGWPERAPTVYYSGRDVLRLAMIVPTGGSHGPRSRPDQPLASASPRGRGWRHDRRAQSRSRRSSRGGGDQPILFERVGDIRHGRAMQYAALGVVIGAAAMHRAAIVSHHDVADRPAVPIDELRPGRERDQFLDQHPPSSTGKPMMCDACEAR